MESFFTTTYSKYKHQVYFFVKKYIQGSADVEDVVQDIFVHLWNHRAGLEINTEAIVYKTAKQEVANFYRRNKLVFSDLEQSDALAVQPPTSVNEAEFLQDSSKVMQLLKLMPEKSTTFFLQHTVDGLSYSQIAKENHISKNAVSKHVNKVLKHLKTNFGLSIFF